MYLSDFANSLATSSTVASAFAAILLEASVLASRDRARSVVAKDLGSVRSSKPTFLRSVSLVILLPAFIFGPTTGIFSAIFSGMSNILPALPKTIVSKRSFNPAFAPTLAASASLPAAAALSMALRAAEALYAPMVVFPATPKPFNISNVGSSISAANVPAR